MGQGKARPAGNGRSLAKGCNAALAHGLGSRRARRYGPAPLLHSLELATTSPALVRLGAGPYRRAEMQDMSGTEH